MTPTSVPALTSVMSCDAELKATLKLFPPQVTFGIDTVLFALFLFYGFSR